MQFTAPLPFGTSRVPNPFLLFLPVFVEESPAKRIRLNLRLRLGYSGAGYSLIRLRDKATGAEAEWDREQWSGDADFIQQLRVMMRIEHVRSFSHDTFGAIQSRMAERFPSYGIVVVHTTTPEEIPHDPDVVY